MACILMGLNICFRELGDMRELDALTRFLLMQNLGYPRYDAWVERTRWEIESGYKKAVLGFSDFELVSDCIYQPHKNMHGFLEIKNLRVREDFRMRDFGRFPLKQVEHDSRGRYDAIIGDVRLNQPEIIGFLRSYGFRELCVRPLYEKDTPDLIMIKWLNPAKRNVLEPLVKENIVTAAF